MKKEALSQFGHPDLILFSFILFFVCFLCVNLWVFHRSRRETYKMIEKLPLDSSKGGCDE